MTPADAALRRALAVHLDPKGGSPYWLEQGDRLRGIDRVADLASLGPFDRSALNNRPMRDFVPRSLLADRGTELVLAETGGTSGPPIRCVFTPEEFRAAFGEPFARAASARRFPRGGSWLYIGPSGPHVIGQAARMLARLQGSLEPFSVDFDPRWARNQDGPVAAIYEEHVIGQALDIVYREQPQVLFATPPILTRLSEELSEAHRARILGIHIGGLPLAPGDRSALRAAFPHAEIIPGYGNSLLGMLPELVDSGSENVDYFSLGGRLVVEVVDEDADGEADLERPVQTGDLGRVVVHRFDPSFLLLNLVERDHATAVEGPPAIGEIGFTRRGLRNPAPVPSLVQSAGIY